MSIDKLSRLFSISWTGMRFYIFSSVCAVFLLSFIVIIRNDKKTTISKPAENEERTGALQALDFWTRARAYPGNDIPPGKYFQATEQLKKRIKQLQRTTQSTSTWESIGPTNLSGRTISVAVNPLNSNTVFVGSASGGLWRSYTAGLGNDWQRVQTGYPVLGVGAIAIAPNDSNLMYIGTGEVYRYQVAAGGLIVRTTRGSYGIGILKTTDGGKTWTKSLDWSEDFEGGVQCIRLNPLNPNTILAATTDDIYKSTDAGKTWYPTLGWRMAEDIIINPLDTTLALASVGNFNSDEAGLYYSHNLGETWTRNSAFPMYSGKTMLDMYLSHPNVIYASVADSTTYVSSLWRSINFGLSWILLSSFDVVQVQGWYSHYVAVHPVDSSQVIRGGVNIYKSIDGGRNFYSGSGSYSDHHTFARDPNNPNIIYDANDDGLYRSTDFGDSYTYISLGMQTGQFYNGFSNSYQDSLLAIGQVQDHIPGYSYTGSLLWGRTAVDECGWTAINPTNDQIMYAIDRNGGNVYRSTTGLSSFSPIFGNSAAFGAWNTPVILAPSNPATIYFGKDFVFKSTNGGSDWSSTSSAVINDGNVAISMGVSFTNPDTVYIGKAPYVAPVSIFRTTNGGTSWTNITNSLPDRYPLDIAVDPKNSRIVYIGFGGYGTGHIFKSTDAGTTWNDISGILPDCPVTAVTVDPQNSNYIYIGTDVGVEVSTDGGTNWNNFSEGLPEAILVSDLTISPSNRTLRVVTHGNGVFERKMPYALPYLTLLHPVGGESWDILTNHQITWDESAVSLVRLEFSTDNGSTWSLIADSVSGISRSFNWHIPYIPTQLAKIKITSVGNNGLLGESQNPFTLYFHGGIIPLVSSWNMISLPTQPPDGRIKNIFTAPHIPVCDLIWYGLSGYNQTGCDDTMKTGLGYWIRYPGIDTIPVAGDSLHDLQIILREGWNMIGSVTKPIPVSSIAADPNTGIGPGSKVFLYRNGYIISDTMYPGLGCWMRADGPGTITLASSATNLVPAALPLKGSNAPRTLVVRDALNRSMSLMFGTSEDTGNQKVYELPPLPPQDGFDIRFSSQRYGAFCPAGDLVKDFPIELQAVQYPLHIYTTTPSDGEWSIVVNDRTVLLTVGSDIVIGKLVKNLLLRFSKNGSSAEPGAYALLQNYPNPFNPSTTIHYDIPEKSRVSMKIYSMLGQEVATLFDQEIDAGSGSVVWDASHLPSGVYIIYMKSGNFTTSRKMLLLR
jgi:photosystem II stability/assembly factor-like uncharacterized protein